MRVCGGGETRKSFNAGSGVVIGSFTMAWEANGLQNTRGWGEKLLRGKAVVLLGNPETWRVAVMQDDYYWLKVTSYPPP